MADGVWTATRDRHDAHAWRLTRTDDQQADTEPVETPRARVYGVLDRDGRAWVAIDGNVIVVAPDETASRRARRHSSSGDALSAPMPATVVAVHVAEGDDVRAGDVVVLLEAMKMEVPLRAPHAGRVTSVRCTPGALVQPGLALVTIEETP